MNTAVKQQESAGNVIRAVRRAPSGCSERHVDVRLANSTQDTCSKISHPYINNIPQANGAGRVLHRCAGVAITSEPQTRENHTAVVRCACCVTLECGQPTFQEMSLDCQQFLFFHVSV